jgi:hypothetical protein
MFITTKLVVSMATGEVLVREGYQYEGPIEFCKGDPYVQEEEATQIQMNNLLYGIFQAQFSEQQQMQSYLINQLEPIIANPPGYGQAGLTAMETSATDTISQQAQNAQQALQDQEYISGRELPSGTDTQMQEQLLSAEGAEKAQAQQQITLANENLKQQQYWSALSMLSGGTGALNMNPLSYAQTFNQGGQTLSGLSQAETASQQSGIMGALGGLAGGGAAGQAGGFGALFCYVAAAIWGGWYEPETIMVRHWLRTEFARIWYGKPVLWFYTKTGHWVSKQRMLVRMLTPLFEMALERARA